MAAANPPSVPARVDDQGPDPNCTIHAVSKALTEGDTDLSNGLNFPSPVCDSLGIDVDQDQITKDLKQRHAKVVFLFCFF